MNIIERPLQHGTEYNNPNRIVIHAMGEYINDPDPELAVDYLDRAGLSAHALILPNADVMICRRPDQGAYHARGFNADSLGVEFLVAGDHNYASFKTAIDTPYVLPAQLSAGVELVKHWQSLYNITHIDRHSDLSPDRKIDPGRGFDWAKFKQLISEA